MLMPFQRLSSNEKCQEWDTTFLAGIALLDFLRFYAACFPSPMKHSHAFGPVLYLSSPECLHKRVNPWCHSRSPVFPIRQQKVLPSAALSHRIAMGGHAFVRKPPNTSCTTSCSFIIVFLLSRNKTSNFYLHAHICPAPSSDDLRSLHAVRQTMVCEPFQKTTSGCARGAVSLESLVYKKAASASAKRPWGSDRITGTQKACASLLSA